MASLQINGAYVVAADQHLYYTDANAAQGVITLGEFSIEPPGTGVPRPDASLTILGSVGMVFDSNAFVAGIEEVNSVSNGPSFLTIGPGGQFSLASEGQADGYWGEAPFTSNGSFSVSTAQSAEGVRFVDLGSKLNDRSGFDNTGAFTVRGNGAFGVENVRDHFFNSGTITVDGEGSPSTGATIGYGAAVTNSGTITAGSVGLSIGGPPGFNIPPNMPDNRSFPPMTVTNTGVITAATAIRTPGASVVSVLHLENSGTLNGDIWAAGTSSVAGDNHGTVIHNTGAINGKITLDGFGNDVYDGRGGALSGGIVFTSGGSGTDTFYLGNDGESVQGVSHDGLGDLIGAANLIVHGGAGADTIVGGMGVNYIDGGAGNDVLTGGGALSTVAFASATTGVTVSLAVQGTAQDTGDGLKTLASFQNLTGSAYNDHLTGDGANNVLDGGGGNDILTGGAGADTFVFRAGYGAGEITDFSHAQGDKISLAAFDSVHTLANVMALTTHTGANTVIALPSGGSITLDNVSSASLTASDFVFPTVTGDFLGTGHASLFWQNAVNNLTSAWLLTDAAPADGMSLPAVTGWQTYDVGNFEGGAYGGDFLLRNTATGMVDIWQDNNGVMAGHDVAQATLDWQIMGAVDFNGDGKSDILWRNEQNGYVSVWQMDGTSVSTTYNPGVVGLQWKLVGANDFYGDGKAEVLWRDSGTGEVNLWTIDGPGAGQTHGQTVAHLGAEWNVAGTGDFNGDGKADILWFDTVTGQVVVWEMNGPTVTAAQPIGDPGPQWRVVDVADISGDGKADILWRDTGTGQVVAWAMNGFKVDHYGVLGTVDNSWKVIDHHYDLA